ncbi:MAG: alanine--tRNA ligase, partial [Candidatus Flemingiibacterium sp.]
CDRYMEIWNNVFSQFDNDGNGNYTELAQKNIDTGMGLERLACVMQGVDNMFLVDTNRKILDKVCEIAKKTYGANDKDDISIRVCTDHIKSAMFMIADGVIPSNEGRGYVLRRIIRRALRHGKLLGIDRPFLAELCEVAMDQNKGAYPELSEKHDYVIKVLTMEEERFDATIDAGLTILSNLMRRALTDGIDTISGEEVFKLYDTFGFPIDLTREIVGENNLNIDEEAFQALMSAQKNRARMARANISGWSESSKTLLAELPKTEFTGYSETVTNDAKVIAILVDDESVERVTEGDCTIILDKTPFYGESGGQVGDVGTIYDHDTMITVTDTKKSDGVYIHLCTLVNGDVKVGDPVRAEVDAMRRVAIQRNHSAAHLLQAALRQVLGNHVEQAGSYVDDKHVRFDFTHFTALTPKELEAVEGLVNAHILLGEDVTTVETDIETAKKSGAMALFGEKYGAVVRMVKMGTFSTELCGGTHVDNTGKCGLFKITSESSVAAGVRRIEGITGLGVLTYLHDKESLIDETAHELKSNPSDIAKRAAQLSEELKAAKHEIESLNAKLAASKTTDIMKNAVKVGSLTVVSAKTEGMTPDAARGVIDDLKSKDPAIVAVIATNIDGKLNLICGCGKDAVKAGALAGKIVGAVAKL